MILYEFNQLKDELDELNDILETLEIEYINCITNIDLYRNKIEIKSSNLN